MSDASELYCTFHSAGRLFGVPVADVREVTAEMNFTHVPHAPVEIQGLANIRGQIFLALDLAALLDGSHSMPRTDSQLVLFKAAVGPAFGIVVDQVGEIVSVAAAQRFESSGESRPPITAGDRAVMVSHLCRLHDQILIVLDPRKFLPCVEHSIKTLLKPSR